MGYNNYRRSNNWCSQDEINQKHHGCFGKIKTRAQSKLHHRSKREIPSEFVDPPPLTNLVATDAGTPNLTGLTITGIVIGSLIGLTITCCLILFIRKRKNSSEGELPTNPRELKSSMAGLTNTSSASADRNDNDRKSTKSVQVEVSEYKKSSEENDDVYIPQYYKGMEVPPLGARIIPLERQVQIAKELTSCNLSPTNNKRKSISISGKRKSTSTTNTTDNNNFNSSTVSLIYETPQKSEGK